MWRMRTRLLTGYLVLLAIGHLPEHGVLGQKYYMNFAFNNNNPDAEGGGGDGGAAGGGPGGPPGGSHEGPPHSPGMDESGPTDGPIEEHHPADTTHEEPGDHGIDENDHGDGDHGSGGDDPGEPHSQGGSGGVGISGVEEHNGGRDDDNDDSDSKDDKDRRQRAEQNEHSQEGKRNDHSHHSSYEISIDDSFGGRYVRSIYESSESHGHSGSQAGSNQRDSGPRDSSAEGPTRQDQIEEAKRVDAEEGQFDGNVQDAPETGVPRGKEDDYEEM
ncbi:accessory gland protein Acp32CD [Drosophila rhopaloa]|uniref:Accessory gland protein Acp32CD n=1 Tax=Drosophila rhopaloa TaxID=1041015 RepID=A0ABM5I618_DRORH|nr:accessory gland protein Acp32CD [Drosophila rhopaloa]XP_016990704.2 accessory gland protein Acp32CD [Drosophila rhopaloa]